MTTNELERILLLAFSNGELISMPCRAWTFLEEGIGQHSGVVLTMADGSQFQIEISQVRKRV